MAMKVTFKRDPLFEDVKKFVQQEKFTSGSRIQRKFSLGDFLQIRLSVLQYAHLSVYIYM